MDHPYWGLLATGHRGMASLNGVLDCRAHRPNSVKRNSKSLYDVGAGGVGEEIGQEVIGADGSKANAPLLRTAPRLPPLGSLLTSPTPPWLSAD